MGMPTITQGNKTPEQVVTDIIESVALQENALSHIINAESEKMQAIIDMEGATQGQLMALNKSAELMLSAITRLEIILQSKLESVISPSSGSCTTL